MGRSSGQAGADVEVTEKMAAAGRAALLGQFSYAPEIKNLIGPYTALDAATAVFKAMISARDN
jgi:hypothetical protein